MSFTITNISLSSQGPFGLITQTTVASSGSFLVTDLLITDFLLDVTVRTALINNNLSITAGSVVLSDGDALQYLDLLSSLTALLPSGQALMTNSSPVVIASNQSAIPITGSITATNPSVSATGSAVPASATLIGGSDGTNLRSMQVSAAGIVSVAVTSGAGDASAANQVTGNTSIASIDTKTPSLGQAAMAASSPVVIASNQTSIPVTATLSAETTKVIGTVNVASSQTIAVTQATGSNLHAVLDAGSAVIGHVINDAGSAIIGKVGIDQTTPGTTNKVNIGTDGIVTIGTGPGTHINDYKNAAAIAVNAVDNHDYTVTALKTLHLNQIMASATGRVKAEITVETGVASGVFTSYFVQVNSTATPNILLSLYNDISVAAGVRVRIIMTNIDEQAQNIYSTICGYEV